MAAERHVLSYFKEKSAEYGSRSKSLGDWMYLLFLGTGALSCFVPSIAAATPPS